MEKKNSGMTRREAYKCIENVVDYMRSQIYNMLATANDEKGSEVVDRIVDETDDFMYQLFGNIYQAVDMVGK